MRGPPLWATISVVAGRPYFRGVAAQLVGDDRLDGGPRMGKGEANRVRVIPRGEREPTQRPLAPGFPERGHDIGRVPIACSEGLGQEGVTPEFEPAARPAFFGGRDVVCTTNIGTNVP